MGIAKYHSQIVQMLRGQMDGPSGEPVLDRGDPELLDWEGFNAVLMLYETSSGRQREHVIQAMGQILQEEDDPAVLAQVLTIVDSLDLTQIEPRVIALRERDVPSEDVQRALDNYFAHRALIRASA